MGEHPELILASGSPRRTALLAAVGVSHRVEPSNCRETWDGESPVEHVARWSDRKALEVAARFAAALVLGVDTTVAVDGRVLGKPADGAEAAAHLSALAGRWHTVYTGCSLRAPAGWLDAGELHRFFAARALRPWRWSLEPRAARWIDASQVRVRALSPDEIADYVATGEPLDKAGAYGIQGLGGSLVEAVVGSWSNVVGLPMETLCEVLSLHDWLPVDWHRCVDVYSLQLA